MPTSAAHEAAAMRFEDLASALDAGLPLPTIGGDPREGERILHGILQRRGTALTPTEDAVLLHAWRAGTAPAALRGQAEERRQRAEFVRLIWQGVRYPLSLLAVALLVATVAAVTIGGWLLLQVAVIVGAVVALGWFVVGSWRRSAAWLGRVPLLGAVQLEAGELSYLATLQSLYGAGVPLLAAHRDAVQTVVQPDTRARLLIADRILQEGRPLREALAEAAALHVETRTLLYQGELAGQLEDALRRALQRRRTVVAHSLQRLARIAGNVLYAAAAVGVLLFLYAYYSNYFAQLGRLGRR